MAKRAAKKDFAKVRAVIQREMANGLTFDQAVEKAEREEHSAHTRIVQSRET